MTAPRDCRPPEGTPDGTVCWLEIDEEEPCDLGPIRETAVWRVRPWWRGGCYFESNTVYVRKLSVRYMTRRGWRFHSIAEPPHECAPVPGLRRS